MKIEESLYNLGYPAYGARFIRDDVLLVAGGGGEGNNGIPNKLTALQVNFKKRKVIKRFRELTLDPNDDSPTTLDAANDIILMGCNESTAKIKSSGENHHLRKYVFENDHLKFVASVDFDRSKSVEDYTKLTYMSQDGSVAAVASSKVPTIIRILNPVALTETYEIETGNDVKDLHFSPDGKVLSYITVSTLEVISIVTGRFIIRKTDFDKNWALSKIRFIGEDTVLIAAALKKGSGIVLVKISLKSGTTSVLKTKLVTTKFKGVTSMDVDSKGQLAALAGNDNSIAIVRLKNFTVAKLFKQVHTFAVTRIVFSPDSKVLASVSAANTLHVILIPDNLALSTSFYEKVVSFFINVILIVIVASVAQVSYKYDLHSKFYGYIHSRFLVKNDTSSYFKINEIFRQTTLVGDVISVSTFTRPIDTELSSVATNYAQTASTESGLDDRDLISDTTVISSSTSFASPTSSFSSISEISSSYKAYDNSVENNYAKSISDKLDITSDTFSSLTASSVTSLASSSITPETLSSSESSITTFDSSLEPSSSFSTRSELTTRVVHDVEQKESRSSDSTSTGKQGLSLSKIPKVTESVLSTTQTKATSLFVSEESTVPTVNTITEEITDPQSTSSTSNAENTSEFSQNPTKDEPTSSSASQDHTILGSSADFSSSSTTTNEVAADSYLSEVFDKDQLTTDQPLTLQTTVEISSSEDISTELTSDDGNYFTSEPPSSVTDVKLNDLKTVVTSTPDHDLSEKSEKSVGSAFSASDKSLETSYQDVSGFEKSVTAELTSSDEKSATTYTSSIDLSFTTEATVSEVGSGQVESAEEELDIYVDARTDVASSQLDDDISRYSSNYGHSTESETTTGTFGDAKETPADIFDEDKEVHAPPTTEWETQKIHTSEESHKAAAIPEDFDDQFTPDLTSVNSVARDGALGSLLTTETKPSSYDSSVTVGPSDPSSVSVSSNEHNSHTNSYSQSELDNDSMDESAFDRSAPFTKNDIEHDEL